MNGWTFVCWYKKSLFAIISKLEVLSFFSTLKDFLYKDKKYIKKIFSEYNFNAFMKQRSLHLLQTCRNRIFYPTQWTKKKTLIWRQVSGLRKPSRKIFLMGLVLDFELDFNCRTVIDGLKEQKQDKVSGSHWCHSVWGEFFINLRPAQTKPEFVNPHHQKKPPDFP